MNDFYLKYDANKKIWYVLSTDPELQYNPKVSINHLINPNNKEKWLNKNLTLHLKMLEWLKINHPEFCI
jgi:hypothetical protein